MTKGRVGAIRSLAIILVLAITNPIVGHASGFEVPLSGVGTLTRPAVRQEGGAVEMSLPVRPSVAAPQPRAVTRPTVTRATVKLPRNLIVTVRDYPGAPAIGAPRAALTVHPLGPEGRAGPALRHPSNAREFQLDRGSYLLRVMADGAIVEKKVAVQPDRLSNAEIFVGAATVLTPRVLLKGGGQPDHKEAVSHIFLDAENQRPVTPILLGGALQLPPGRYILRTAYLQAQHDQPLVLTAAARVRPEVILPVVEAEIRGLDGQGRPVSSDRLIVQFKRLGGARPVPVGVGPRDRTLALPPGRYQVRTVYNSVVRTHDIHLRDKGLNWFDLVVTN